MNVVAYASGALILYILWSILVPPKWYRDKFYQDELLKDKKASRTYVRDVIKGIYIQSVSFERGHTSGIINKRLPQVFSFDGIIRGDFSQTIYLRVDQDGKLYEFDTDLAAKAAYIESDLGIVAITVSDGQIRFRDIQPNGKYQVEMFKVRFNFVPVS